MKVKPAQTFTEPVHDIIEILSQAARYAGSFSGIIVELKIEYLGLKISARSIPQGQKQHDHIVGWKDFDGALDQLGFLQAGIDKCVKGIRYAPRRTK